MPIKKEVSGSSSQKKVSGKKGATVKATSRQKQVSIQKETRQLTPAHEEKHIRSPKVELKKQPRILTAEGWKRRELKRRSSKITSKR